MKEKMDKISNNYQTSDSRNRFLNQNFLIKSVFILQNMKRVFIKVQFTSQCTDLELLPSFARVMNQFSR
jgi:hypothetical protein